MVNYADGKIYILRSNKTDSVYIGSTCSPLFKRLYQHKLLITSNAERKCNSIKLFESDATVTIELLEDFPCNSKLELEMRENEWIKKTEKVINKVLPGNILSKKEYNEYYRKENAEAIKKKEKEYKEAHKEEAKEKHRLWAEENKDKIKANKQTIITCEKCGKETSKGNKWRHDKVCGTEIDKSIKLTKEKVLQIRNSVGKTQRELAKEFGVNHSTIGQILRKEIWKDDFTYTV